jgi:hypothetical protein
MRRTRRRRSTSSWVSPGPLVPIPPACWLSPPPQPVAQQGQFHLGLALGAAGVLGEDIEDHRGAVDGGAAEQLLQVAVLGRRELVVEDDGIGIEGAAQRGDLLRLPAPHEGGRVGGVAPLHYAADHVGPGAVHQQGQLVQRLVDRLDRESGEDHPH